MRINVVGAGIIGLTSALRLAQAGHAVSIIAAELPARTTSAVAGGLWYPYRAYPEPEVGRWSAIGYRVLSALAEDPRSGVVRCNGRELFRQPVPDPWWRFAVPELHRAAPERLPSGYRDGYELVLPVVAMEVHLRWLVAELEGRGTSFHIRQLRTLADAADGADIVVNCSGLGARKLVADDTVRPVRGQVAVLTQFGLREWLLDQSDEYRLTYLIPRRDVVIVGGTAEVGNDSTTPDAATIRAIIERAAALVPDVARAEILAEKAGLRPARPAVRLESETAEGLPVIHCYGHGGAGVTMAYGCAEDVLAQVKSVEA